MILITCGDDETRYRSIGAAEAADTTMSATVESEKREDVDTETVTHGLVLLVVHLKKLHIRVLLCQLTYLQQSQTITIRTN